jgi:hypothetical protein
MNSKTERQRQSKHGIGGLQKHLVIFASSTNRPVWMASLVRCALLMGGMKMATEKRLIDAYSVIRKIDNYYNNSPFTHPGTTWLRGLELATGLLLAEPTVDAVEVVFCDYCVKHGGCYTEDVFRLARIEKPYCCAGKSDGDGNG